MTPSIAKTPAVLRCALGLAVVFAPMVVAAMERPVSRHPTALPIVKLLASIAPARSKPAPVMALVWKYKRPIPPATYELGPCSMRDRDKPSLMVC